MSVFGFVFNSSSFFSSILSSSVLFLLCNCCPRYFPFSLAICARVCLSVSSQGSCVFSSIKKGELPVHVFYDFPQGKRLWHYCQNHQKTQAKKNAEYLLDSCHGITSLRLSYDGVFPRMFLFFFSFSFSTFLIFMHRSISRLKSHIQPF